MSANDTIHARVQHPFLTAEALAAANPVLLAGEVVYESDTRRHKIGDGTTPWNELPYAGSELPDTIPAAMVDQDPDRRFVSDDEKSAWNAKADKKNATSTAAGLMSAADKIKLDRALTDMMAVAATSPLTVSGGCTYYSEALSLNVQGIGTFSGSNDCAMIVVPGNMPVTFGSAFKLHAEAAGLTGTASQWKVYVIQRVTLGPLSSVCVVSGAIYG